MSAVIGVQSLREGFAAQLEPLFPVQSRPLSFTVEAD